jgi:G:T-mismatch repair DNA endonuclease (very short patch repair protein)
MRNNWSDIEINILKIYYPNTNDINIVKYFNGRTLTSIKIKAKRLKIYRNDKIKKCNRSNGSVGIKNGMYGKSSKLKGKTYDEYYGNEKSKIIKDKLSNNNIGKIGSFGSKNGMYKKIPYNKGISPSNEIKNKIKSGINNYWNNLNKFELKKRKDKLREDWIIKRKKYSEIDTIPEIITENILLKLKIKYQKKINIGYYNCDFVVNNIIIEVQGDYWHGNPKFYNSFDKIQEKNINRDKRKLKFLQSKGYLTLYLWENDLKHNVDYCENQLIKHFYE